MQPCLWHISRKLLSASLNRLIAETSEYFTLQRYLVFTWEMQRWSSSLLNWLYLTEPYDVTVGLPKQRRLVELDPFESCSKMWPCEEKWPITSPSLCLQQVNPLNTTGYFMYHHVLRSQTAGCAYTACLQKTSCSGWAEQRTSCWTVGRHLTVKCTQETELLRRPAASWLSAWLSTTGCCKQYGCVCSIHVEQLTTTVSSLWLHDDQPFHKGRQYRRSTWLK